MENNSGFTLRVERRKSGRIWLLVKRDGTTDWLVYTPDVDHLKIFMRLRDELST